MFSCVNLPDRVFVVEFPTRDKILHAHGITVKPAGCRYYSVDRKLRLHRNHQIFQSDPAESGYQIRLGETDH